MDVQQIIRNTRGYSDHYANLIHGLLHDRTLAEAGPRRMQRIGIEPFIIEFKYTQSPWPVIIGPRLVEEFRSISANFLPLFQRAVVGHFGSDPDAFHEYIGWPREIYRFMMSNMPDPEDFIVRYDGLFSDGVFKIVELNVGSTCGGWYTDFIQQIYRDSLSDAGLLEHVRFRPLLRARFDNIIARISGLQKASKTGNLLYLMDPMQTQDNIIACLQRGYDEARPASFTEGKVFWTCDPDAVVYRGGEIFFEGHAIDGVFAKKQIPLLPNELLGKLAIAQARKKVLCPDTPSHQVFGSKILLALLHEWRNSGKATATDAELIERYIPWSARLREQTVVWNQRAVPLLQLVRDEKDQFVLKLSNAARGDAVFVGRYQTQQRWNELLEEKLPEKHWLIQEYCSPDKLAICDEHSTLSVGDHVWGVCANGSHYGGAFVRGITGEAADGVVNSARGAYVSLVVEADR